MDSRGSILVSTHKENPTGDVISTSSAGGMTDRMVDLVIAIRNASQVPGPGVIVASYQTSMSALGLDPLCPFWSGVIHSYAP